MFKSFSREQKFILIVLSLINFFNYVDRQVIFPLFHSIKAEFGVNDFQLGLLGTVFMLVHSLSSLPMGMLADRIQRKYVIAGGVLFWSITSFASGLSQSFRTLLGIRSLVGVGEASYAPAATAMISDNVPQTMWARAQGVFNAAMFIGGTLGAMIGGVVAFYAHGNWRLAFFLVSIPGLILAALSLYLKDTGVKEKQEDGDLSALFSNVPFLWLLLSGTLTTFAAGAFVSWGVEFVSRYQGYNLRDASLVLGGTLMIAGVIGVFAGSYLADYLQKKFIWGRSITVAASLVFAAPFMYMGLQDTGTHLQFLFYFFIGTVLLSVYHGPATAVLHDIVPHRLRATAFALYVLVIHLLGDTLAPAVVGKISDRYNLRAGLEWSTVLVFLSGLAFFMVSELIRKRGVVLAQES